MRPGLIKGWLAAFLLAAGLLPPPGLAQKASPAARATRPYTGYHRYRGTVGTQPVTVELTIGLADGEPTLTDCQGVCRFGSSATRPREVRSWHPLGPHEPLQLVEADTGQLGWRTGFWQARQPAGPVLTGTWTDAAGRQQPFALHEDYRDERGRLAAMPYEIIRAGLLKVAGCIVAPDEWSVRGGQPAAMFDRQFLHFLGPDTLQGSMAALQCPPPAARRQQVWQEMQAEFSLDSIGRYRQPPTDEQSLTFERSYTLEVLYQGNGLLSWGEYSYAYHGGVHGGHTNSLSVYDLNEGVFLELTQQLRPGAERALCGLLARHLQADEQNGGLGFDKAVALVNLPEAGFAVVENGLLFQYGDYEVSGYVPPNPVVISYAELQPLLRPDSPVAVCCARGLWRAARRLP